MQRIVHLLPVDGEIFVGPEVAVAEHLGRNVAEFYEQAQLTAESFRKLAQQNAENRVGVGVHGVFAFAVYSPLGKIIWWEKPPTPAYGGEDMANNAAFAVDGNGHIRGLAWCLLHYPEQLHAVEEVMAHHIGGQLLAMGGD